VFGDILVWVVTFFGLVPWEKLFGRKKDFQEQLAEFGDDNGSNILVYPGVSCNNDVATSDISNGSDCTEEIFATVVPNKYHSGDDAADAIMQAYVKGQCAGYTCRVGRRF